MRHIMLNPRLIARQQLDGTAVSAITALHHRMDARLDAITEEDDPVEVAKEIEAIEFEMQKAWGFDLRADMHTHWHRPRTCRCDGRENNMRWSSRMFVRVVAADCPFHGEGGYRNSDVDYEIHDRAAGARSSLGDTVASSDTRRN